MVQADLHWHGEALSQDAIHKLEVKSDEYTAEIIRFDSI